MGRRGPKPKSKAIRIFEGDPGNLLASRHAGEIDPPKCDGVPPPPKSLAGPIAIAEWNAVAPALHASGVLTKLDLTCLHVYCDAVAAYMLSLSHKTEESVTTNFKTGAQQKSPWVEINRQAAETIKAYAAMFGLNPVSRVGLKGGPATPQAADGKGLESMAL